jgi:hypothetical protein
MRGFARNDRAFMRLHEGLLNPLMLVKPNSRCGKAAK